MRGVPSGPRRQEQQPRVVERADDLLHRLPRRPRDAIGELRDEGLGDVPPVPVADQAQRRFGHALGDEPPGGGEILDVLVRLEHADEERPRLGRQVGWQDAP